MAWSPDGRWLASGSSDRTVRLWDPVSGAERLRCTGHEHGVGSVAWSAGRALAGLGVFGPHRAAVGPDQRTGSCPDRPSCEWSRAVAFSPDGACVASASDDSTVALWDVADLVQPRARPVESGPVRIWLQRQAATVGRRAVVVTAPRELWVPHLPGADVEGCLGVLRQGSGAFPPHRPECRWPDAGERSPRWPAALLGFDHRPVEVGKP